MEVLALIIVIVIIAAIVIVYRRGAQVSATLEADVAAPKRRDPFADQGGLTRDAEFFGLKIGDLVKLDEKDFFVRRQVSSTEANYTWNEFLLDDGSGTRYWLSVEDDDGLDLGLWTKVPLADVTSGSPGEQSLVVHGKAFKLKEQGSANYRSDVDTEDPSSGSLDYLQYEAADKTMLSFQRYDGAESWDPSVGTHRTPTDFDIYPASAS